MSENYRQPPVLALSRVVLAAGAWVLLLLLWTLARDHSRALLLHVWHGAVHPSRPLQSGSLVRHGSELPRSHSSPPLQWRTRRATHGHSHDVARVENATVPVRSVLPLGITNWALPVSALCSCAALVLRLFYAGRRRCRVPPELRGRRRLAFGAVAWQDEGAELIASHPRAAEGAGTLAGPCSLARPLGTGPAGAAEGSKGGRVQWAMAAESPADDSPFPLSMHIDNDMLFATGYAPDNTDSLAAAMPLHADPIRWLPAAALTTASEGREGELVMPLMPVPHQVVLPVQRDGITLSEPRYRRMCADIVMGGARRFVMVLQQPGPLATGAASGSRGSVAAVGAVLYVTDFQRPSIADDADYVIRCRPAGRVAIRRVLNAAALGDSVDGYLRAVVEELPPDAGDCAEAEARVSETFKEMCRLQYRLERAESAAASALEALEGQGGVMAAPDEAAPAVPPDWEALRKEADAAVGGAGADDVLELLLGSGGLGCLYDAPDDGVNLASEARFWQTAGIWQLLLMRRLETLTHRLTVAEQRVLEQSVADPQVQAVLETDFREAERRLARLAAAKGRGLAAEFHEGVRPLVSLLIWFLQTLLQEPSHGKRLEMLQAALSREVMRLRAKAALKALK